MSTLSKIVLCMRNIFFKQVRSCQACNVQACSGRNYSDTPKKPMNKEVVVQGTGNELRVRVRRARPADTERVLRFVCQQVHNSWPGLVAPPVASRPVLDDFMARTLAQGHTMLAEQYEPRLGWTNIRGVALGCSISPWDAVLLEKFARCIRCPKARQLIDFSAHCMRGPALHKKYRVHKILQILLIVPPHAPNSSEIALILAKNAIKRGRDVGFALLRFDVNNKIVEKSLRNLQLKKEWHLSYEIIPEKKKITNKEDIKTLMKETDTHNIKADMSKTEDKDDKTNYVTVYTKTFVKET